ILLSALETESAPRARLAAITALGQLGTAEAEQALLEAARGDSDSANREAAIRKLAENPDTRGRLGQMLSEEPNERLRTIGECTAKLAELGSEG
ncbi:MAG: HEAT repeat domain-containing protein, partial [Candidatus Binatia bacterium]